MFDRHTHRHNAGQSIVTVTEKRAPTDESARLLREMEAAAQARVIAVHEVKDNDLNGKIVIQRRDYDNAWQAFAIFSLNGKRHEIKVDIDETEFSKTPRAVYAMLFGRLSAKIAEALTTAYLRDHTTTSVGQ